jgi:hypothetical protein
MEALSLNKDKVLEKLQHVQGKYAEVEALFERHKRRWIKNSVLGYLNFEFTKGWSEIDRNEFRQEGDQRVDNVYVNFERHSDGIAIDIKNLNLLKEYRWSNNIIEFIEKTASDIAKLDNITRMLPNKELTQFHQEAKNQGTSRAINKWHKRTPWRKAIVFSITHQPDSKIHRNILPPFFTMKIYRKNIDS